MRFTHNHRGEGRNHGGHRHGFHMMARGAGGREGGGWGEHHRGRRRLFDSGELRLVLLRLIGEQPRHGYDLIRAIEDLTGGAYAPSPGIIYPTLTMLQDMGHIDEQKGEGARRLFAIAPEGTILLAERKEEIDALFARLAQLSALREKTDGAPIRRAMMNLKAVLQHRLGREDVEPATLHDVAAILDEAARRIERL